MRELTRAALLRTAEAVNYPPVTVGRSPLRDRGDWAWAVAHSDEEERAVLLEALRPNLLAGSPEGLARLASRAATRRKPAADEPYCLGEAWALPLVTSALAMVDDVVRHDVVRRVCFLAVGRECNAFFGSAVFVDSEGCRKERLILLGPKSDLFICLHEIGHCWHSAKDSGWPAMTSAGQEAFVAHMREVGEGERIAEYSKRSEALADGLAFAWLFGPTKGRPS